MHYYNHLSIWDPETGIVHRYCSVRIIVLSSTYAFLRQLELFIRKLPRWKKQLSYLRGNFISYNPSLIVSYINRLLLMCLLTLSSVSLQLYSHDCQFQSTHRVTSQLAPSLPLPLPPSTPSHIMLPPPNMSISCLRCTDFCLQCSVYSSLPLQKKYLCHQCESTGLDCCLFPPAIRLLNSWSNSRCISCIEHRKKCIFFRATDSQCTHCSKRHLSCCFTLNGDPGMQ